MHIFVSFIVLFSPLYNLNATREDALYTTYTADLSSSEFIIDEGYSLIWHDDDKGIGFKTDTGGNLYIAFRLEGNIRFTLSDMIQDVRVRKSYANMVIFEFEPYDDIRIRETFLCYSSRIVLNDICIINDRDSTIFIELYPFFEYGGEGVLEAAFVDDGFRFSHYEPPDGWTLYHNIPYEDHLIDVYIMDTEPTSFGGYNYLGSPGLKMANYCVEWGTVEHSDSTPCEHLPPISNQVVYLNDDIGQILTEDAPKWGDPDPNIPGNGYQGCELGNFDNLPPMVGDSFIVYFSCLETEEEGIGKGMITELPDPDGVRVDMVLSPDIYLTPPTGVRAVPLNDTTSWLISWDYIDGLYYNLYRRPGDEDGRFDLLASDLETFYYLDTYLQNSTDWIYTLIVRNGDVKSGHSVEVGAISVDSTEFFGDIMDGTLSNHISSGDIRVLALEKEYEIHSGDSVSFRLIRGVTAYDEGVSGLLSLVRSLCNIPLEPYIIENEERYSPIPCYEFSSPDEELMYWSAFSLIHQLMLPPEGECSYNYYLFSREPTWGWGHGGQVFHESLSMLAYVFMNPLGAMNSQRVYMERQNSNPIWLDGYIPYRVGPYLNETIWYNNSYTSSAPWFSWENWEIYIVSQDTTFLREAYNSGVEFYNFWIIERDDDNDGLCEWGGHAVLECVRDGAVVIWDQVGWPSNFECLDLNCLLVKEAKSLANMALELGDSANYQYWTIEANDRINFINQYMWDTETKFYYHVDKDDHDFTYFSSNDLKHQEIIGFLPLWAGIASQEQADYLLEHLIDPDKFWRNYGIPSLSALDPYYNPMGYWNGPVWVEWNYLIFRGLLDYGYLEEAENIAQKVFDNVIYQLKNNHYFWELYSPDYYSAGHHHQYIWSGLVARMLIDLEEYTKVEEYVEDTRDIFRIYPNPFREKTVISYQLSVIRKDNKPITGHRLPITLSIYDLSGRLARTFNLPPSLITHHSSVIWDGRDEEGVRLPCGIYLCRLVNGEKTFTKKIILLR